MPNDTNYPDWIEPKLFEILLRQSQTAYKEIKDFRVLHALAPGENYASIMLKVQADIILIDGSTQTLSYMLKVPHRENGFLDDLKKFNIFDNEYGMYAEILPKFEDLFGEAGTRVRFGAKSYHLDIDKEYILLEDLTKYGFANLKRQNCFDLGQCESVLKKMAQWHAASVAFVQKHGMFKVTYQRGFINDDGKDFLKIMLENAGIYILKNVESCSELQDFYQPLEFFFKHFAENLYNKVRADTREFNVLNHGDCWMNNIMFQYDKQGKLNELLFVDYQIPRWGTPVQDLLYFIFSSAQLELKANKLDYLIQYYHENLVKNLKLLKTNQSIPTLTDIQAMITKYSIWAMFPVCLTLPMVLCDTSDKASLDNIVVSTKEGHEFKMMLYCNERFIRHLKVILPWLHSKGTF